MLVSNVGQLSGQSSNAVRVFARAQGFTTGANSNGYTLESIEIRTVVSTAALTAQEIATIKAELWSSSSGKPGRNLANLTAPSSFPTGTRNSAFSAPAGTTLAANTEYHVVVYTTAETLSNLNLNIDSSDAEDSGAAAGWSIANVLHYFRNGSAAPTASSTWTADTVFGAASLLIRVNGEAVPETAPSAAPTGLMVTPGDGSLALSWTAPSGTVTGYDVHYTSALVSTVLNDATVQTGGSPSAADGWVAASHSGATASQSITGLTNNTAYRVRVRAKNSGGPGPWAHGRGTPAPRPGQVWSGTLNPGNLYAGFLGCDPDNFHCLRALSPGRTFTHNGTSYGIESVVLMPGLGPGRPARLFLQTDRDLSRRAGCWWSAIGGSPLRTRPPLSGTTRN